MTAAVQSTPPPVETSLLEDRDVCLQLFLQTRRDTETLAQPLSPEDQNLQSMPEASPVKWHRAHTTWFHHAFILKDPDLLPHPEYDVLFNSYYQSHGPQHPRPQRHLISVPSCSDVASWRRRTDDAVQQLILNAPEKQWKTLLPLIILGVHHEKQHQELLLTDLLHAASHNPILPALYPSTAPAQNPPPAQIADDAVPKPRFLPLPNGSLRLGANPNSFHFDNETPQHEVLLNPSLISSHPVSNSEYLQFILDDGYARPTLWLADGWDAVQQNQWKAPLYWRLLPDSPPDNLSSWRTFSLAGEQSLQPHAPVHHVSFYEAYAFASWRNARLPLEAEAEALATLPNTTPPHHPCVNIGRAASTADGRARSVLPAPPDKSHPSKSHPSNSHAQDPCAPLQVFGDVWEWTGSPYAPYPGFQIPKGPVGEYNGKFMCNQFVLRGGSCATPAQHVRPSYRNFHHPHSRWQFSGFRIAKNAH